MKVVPLSSPITTTVDVLKNEPMLFSASPGFALSEGGPLTNAAVKSLLDLGEFKLDRGNVVIDTRVHMLKPGWLPAIGGWHCDAIPRGDDGQPELDHPAIPGIRHYLMVVDCGSGSMTQFIDDADGFKLPAKASPGKNLWGEHSEIINRWIEEECPCCVEQDITTVESGVLYKFTARDYHRAIPATGHGWRFFFRASVNTLTKGPFNEIRRQVQTYIPHEDFGW